jgi:hypothetical protein
MLHHPIVHVELVLPTKDEKWLSQMGGSSGLRIVRGVSLMAVSLVVAALLSVLGFILVASSNTFPMGFSWSLPFQTPNSGSSTASNWATVTNPQEQITMGDQGCNSLFGRSEVPTMPASPCTTTIPIVNQSLQPFPEEEEDDERMMITRLATDIVSAIHKTANFKELLFAPVDNHHNNEKKLETSILTTSTTTCEESVSRRFCSSAPQRERRRYSHTETLEAPSTFGTGIGFNFPQPNHVLSICVPSYRSFEY